MRGNTWVNFRSCARTGVTCGIVQTARGKHLRAEMHLQALLRVLGVMPVMPVVAKANLVEVVLHLEHALALGYSAGAPDKTHKMTKTTF